MRRKSINLWFDPFAQAANMTITGNVYNGNTTLVSNSNTAPFGYENTNNNDLPGGIGLVWIQYGGNYFIARNMISNYCAEAIQCNAGPNAIAGNTFYTLISDYSCCAVNSSVAANAPGLVGTNTENYYTTFVGNSVY